MELNENSKLLPHNEDIDGLIETVIDESGAAYTIQHMLKYLVTMYSKDKQIILVKHSDDIEDARTWACNNLWRVL